MVVIDRGFSSPRPACWTWSLLEARSLVDDDASRTKTVAVNPRGCPHNGGGRVADAVVKTSSEEALRRVAGCGQVDTSHSAFDLERDSTRILKIV